MWTDLFTTYKVHSLWVWVLWNRKCVEIQDFFFWWGDSSHHAWWSRGYRVFRYIWVTYTYIIILIPSSTIQILLLIATSVILWFFLFIVYLFMNWIIVFTLLATYVYMILSSTSILDSLLSIYIHWFVDTNTAITTRIMWATT